MAKRRLSIWEWILPDQPLLYLAGYRVAAILGRYGSGKTLLAVALTEQLLRRRWAAGVVSNLPLAIPGLRRVDEYASRPTTWPTEHVILADEAWSYLFIDATPKELKSFLAYLRKNGNYLLLPTVLPLSRYVRSVEIEREFNFAVLGLPFWAYRIRLPGGDRDGIFYLSYRRYYGWYDTEYQPGDKWFVYSAVGDEDQEEAN